MNRNWKELSFIKIRYYLVLFNPDVWSSNAVWCRGLNILTTYFMMTTYCWMLAEGAFLRMILVKTFIEEEMLLVMLCILGWILPIFIILPYIFYRLQYENELCWMDPGHSVIFLAVPAIIVFVLNIYFLCNVIQVLKSKLQFETVYNSAARGGSGTSTGSTTAITLKSARAVIILIPIFGLHFLLLPIRPGRGSPFEYGYEVISSLSTSTQGLAVSLLLCFSNSEILTKLKKCFKNIRSNRNPDIIDHVPKRVILLINIYVEEFNSM